MDSELKDLLAQLFLKLDSISQRLHAVEAVHRYSVLVPRPVPDPLVFSPSAPPAHGPTTYSPPADYMSHWGEPPTMLPLKV